MSERHASLARGALLGRYEVESLLGAGGMGEVYVALDRTLGRKVALKVLPTDCSSDRVLRLWEEDLSTYFNRGTIYGFDWSRDGKSIAVLQAVPSPVCRTARP